MIRKFLFTAVALMCALSLSAGNYELKSPDGKLRITVTPGQTLTYSMSYDGKVLISPSEAAMDFSDKSAVGHGKVSGISRFSIDKEFSAEFYRKAKVQDKCNGLVLKYKAGAVEFRAYNDGFAWRFCVNRKPKAYRVVSETAVWNFAEDFDAYIPFTKPKKSKETGDKYMDDFETLYTHCRLSSIPSSRKVLSPMMVEGPDGLKMVLVESDVIKYPGMSFWGKEGTRTITGQCTPYPDSIVVAGHNGLQQLVYTRKPYLAECDGSARTFPWRGVCISVKDCQLTDNDMVYRLATPCPDGEDFSWVKPGKVAWEWWNNWHVEGVGFKAGINNDTYKHYIDFAAANNIEYVILDEGWAVKYANDLLKVVPDIDVKELVDYAASKNVGIILWAGYYPFEKDMENVFRTYSEMGVKGFKVDFFNRDDQMVEKFLYESAEMAARYRMVMDYHGIHKPTGLQRRFPNILNYEGIYGLEMMRRHGLKESDMVTGDVTVPFIRFVAGFADYTQGAMLNGTKKTFRPNVIEPMSQGTRCHQIAEYVIFDAPLDMLCDSPSNYTKEAECTRYITSFPTVWDETKAIDGKVAEYVVLARRRGDKWYLGALNNWESRDIEVDLSIFGDAGSFNVESFRDGPNADKFATDYIRSEERLSGKLRIHLAQGGGFAATITPVK